MDRRVRGELLLRWPLLVVPVAEEGSPPVMETVRRTRSLGGGRAEASSVSRMK